MTNYKVRPDGLNPPEGDFPAFDTASDERSIWKPSDNLLKAVNFPPRQCATQTGAVPSGFYFLHRVRIPAGVAITNIHAWVYTAGASLTYAAAAVYDEAGVRLGITGSQTAVWNSTGQKTMALGSPIPAQSKTRFVWIALTAAGTTLPSFAAASVVISGNAGIPTANPSAAPRNNGYIAGATPLPDPMPNMGWITDWYEIWVGVS